MDPMATTGGAGSDLISGLLRAGRIRKGWKQADLAEQAGVSRTTLIHLERGAVQEPRASTLNKLAQALELDPADLVAPRSVRVAEPAAFDRSTNPALQAAAERYPERFRDLTADDWAELAGQFGVGGGLTEAGALAAVERLQADKATLHKLRLVLQTHLREPAQQVIDALYRAVEVAPGAGPRSASLPGDALSASVPTSSSLTPDA
jgi:transcriptional regulator with XRE-family HTH domain